ncbi:MAG: ATP-dependent Clp protease proteolytic subunit, partial [Cyanobacteria bacterium]|nr:ATP-dependent Clp protease proteolytic subunit [Cyanobacteriota bacterium]
MIGLRDGNAASEREGVVKTLNQFMLNPLMNPLAKKNQNAFKATPFQGLHRNLSVGVSHQKAQVDEQNSTPSSPLPFTQGISQAFKAQRLPSLQFNGAIHNDYSVEIRGDVPINANTASQLLQGMLLRDIAKGEEEPSSLKFYLGSTFSDAYRQPDQAAMADTMTFVTRPVDVVVKSAITSDSLKTLLSATGKRFMYPGATIYVGASETAAGYAKNKDAQVRRKLFNDYLRDLHTLIALKTGKTDAKEIHADTMSNKDYNALQSLYYGKNGLVDGILIGFNQVITRKDLDAFFKAKGWTPKKNAKQIEAFNKEYLNVYKVAKANITDLEKFSPLSLVTAQNRQSEEYVHHETLHDHTLDNSSAASQPGEGEDGDSPVKMGTVALDLDKLVIDPEQAIQTEHGIFVKVRQEAEKPPITYYFESPRGIGKTKHLGLNGKVTKEPRYDHVEAVHVPHVQGSILNDDVIFFNDAFTDNTAESISEALITLDDKKRQEKSPSHIKIIENSPGGSIWSGQELRGTIGSLKTPVDVIVTGMGASCG